MTQIGFILLVMFINGTSQHSASLTSTQFDSKSVCEAAGAWVEAEWRQKAMMTSGATKMTWTCAKK